MNEHPQRRPACDEDWRDVAAQWSLREGTIYLNHGSFGVAPRCVQRTRLDWIRQFDAQPMDCFVRQLEPALLAARARLAGFVGTQPENLVFVENATVAMNVVAKSFPLSAGDEVLINNHEYGAVRRIWKRVCRDAGAELVEARLSCPFASVADIIEPILSHITNRTKLLIVSHITSPTAVIFPVAEICRAARQRGVATCIDGPHALAQLDVCIDQLPCDFYTASCHKWLSAPFGSGFLFAHPDRQAVIRPLTLSWGRLLPNVPMRWDDEFTWMGTRDPSSFLSVPAAIDFLNDIGIDQVRQRQHELARYARRRLETVLSRAAIVPDDPNWYGAMAEVPLPDGDWTGVQSELWNQCGIEVPLVHFEDRWFIRVSCHLYNMRDDIDRLADVLERRLSA
jgi:isopenicillin-N epimerase